MIQLDFCFLNRYYREYFYEAVVAQRHKDVTAVGSISIRSDGFLFINISIFSLWH